MNNADIFYGIWIARAYRYPGVLPFTLRTIKLIDDRIANPAYAGLFVTGTLMAFGFPLALTTPRLLVALFLHALLVPTGLLGYARNLHRQIQLVQSEGFTSSVYQAEARRGTLLASRSSFLRSALSFSWS